MFSFMNKTISNSNQTLFDFKINSIDGSELDLSKFKGKTLLIVNVASKCGFTKQYADLQNLYDLYKFYYFVSRSSDVSDSTSNYYYRFTFLS